jgi:hypothetical protein
MASDKFNTSAWGIAGEQSVYRNANLELDEVISGVGFEGHGGG